MEMDREGFMVVIELDPSSSLVSVCLSAVRKLSSSTREQNGDRLILVHVATHGYDSEVRHGQSFSTSFSSLLVTIEVVDHLSTLT